MADGRYVVAVPAETAVLSGCLGNLKELKAQGVNTLVFRTQLRETALNIDSMLSLGVDDTLFVLTHSGERCTQRAAPLNNQPPKAESFRISPLCTKSPPALPHGAGGLFVPILL